MSTSELTIRERNWLRNQGQAQIEAKFDALRGTLSWVRFALDWAAFDDVQATNEMRDIKKRLDAAIGDET